MSDIVQFFEWMAIIVLVAYLVYEYSAKETHCFVKIVCFISWLFSFGIVVIIPMDIYFSYHLSHVYKDGEAEEYKQDTGFQNIRTIWKIYYYVNQILSWIVLPLIYSYESAGEFNFEGKFKRAIMDNVWFYAVFLVLFGFILLYMVAYGSFSIDQLLIFMAALSNSVLLLMVVVLLGHGIVSIPKFYWDNRKLDDQLKYYQQKTNIAYEEKTKSEKVFEQAIKTLYYISQKPSNSQFASYFQKIFEKIPEDYKDKTYKNSCQHMTPQHFNMEKILLDFNEMNMQKVINLNLEVKEAFMQLKRANMQWEATLDKAFLMEDIIDNKSHFDFKIRSTLWIQKKGECGTLMDNLYLLWQIRLKKYWMNTVCIISALLSIVVLLSQIASFTEQSQLNIIRYILDRHYGFYTTQILVLVPLVYIMVCVNYSLFNLKTFSFLQFYANQQTDSVALMFGSLNFARVSAPICYNFLQMLNLSNTAYQSIMGPMDIVPIFGEANIYFYPVILIILSLFNLFNIYKFCLSELELDQYDFSDQINSNKIEGGKQLLYKARIERERKFLSLQSTNLRQLEGYNNMGSLRQYNNNELDTLMYSPGKSFSYSDLNLNRV